MLPELLPFIMQAESFHQHSIRESKGSVNPYVNFSDLAWYELALPPPEEQRRIAGLLLQAGGLTEKLVLLRESAVNAFCSAASLKYSALCDNYPTVRLSEICLKKPQSGIYKSDKVPLTNVCKESKSSPRLNCVELATCESQQ